MSNLTEATKSCPNKRKWRETKAWTINKNGEKIIKIVRSFELGKSSNNILMRPNPIHNNWKVWRSQTRSEGRLSTNKKSKKLRKPKEYNKPRLASKHNRIIMANLR